MIYDLYLSYSGRKTYLSCPLKYKFVYIQKPDVPKDPRSSMFGSSIGLVFEWFYNRKLWADPDPEARCLKAADLAVEDICDKNEISISSDPKFVSDLRADVRKFIPTTISTIKKHRLLSLNSRSEVDLTINYSSKRHNLALKIGGRADFVHGPKPVWIIDGKGSIHREKYVDSEQLIWYATQHYLKYHVAPDRLGFMHYRFPDDPIQWIMYDEKDMRSSLMKTFNVARKILEGEFEPSPSDECKLCDFRILCSDGSKHVAAKKIANGGRVESSIFDLENVTS